MSVPGNATCLLPTVMILPWLFSLDGREVFDQRFEETNGNMLRRGQKGTGQEAHPAGTYLLRVGRVGCVPLERTVTLRAGQVTELDLELQPQE